MASLVTGLGGWPPRHPPLAGLPLEEARAAAHVVLLRDGLGHGYLMRAGGALCRRLQSPSVWRAARGLLLCACRLRPAFRAR